jgi:hypothetical protein
MAASTGLILAAAGIVIVNEAVFAPAVSGTPILVDFNWRLIPAAAVAAFTLAGLEQISKPLGVGLAALALLSVLIVPIGNASTPIENATRYLRITK